MRALSRRLFARQMSWQEKKTMKSPTDEIRAIRHALAAKFDNDIHRIYEDIVRQQCESGRKYIRLPKREPRGIPVRADLADARSAAGQK